MRFRKVVARYPQERVLRQRAARHRRPLPGDGRRFDAGYASDAVQAYRRLVAEYPSSSLGEKALFNVVEIARADGGPQGDRGRGPGVPRRLPRSPRAAEVKAAVKKGGKPRRRPCPLPRRAGLAQVFNLRFWSGANSTRVVLDVEKRRPLQIRPHQQPRPPVGGPRRARASIRTSWARCSPSATACWRRSASARTGHDGARGPGLQGREGRKAGPVVHHRPHAVVQGRQRQNLDEPLHPLREPRRREEHAREHVHRQHQRRSPAPRRSPASSRDYR